jgi:DNA replication initiation complex subunit (GINS family)
MADTPVTYEQLFDTLRREKSRDDLQKLDKEFYEKVRIFLATKQDTIVAESNAQGIQSLAVQRAHIEYQNVKKILKELYERRERKIITLALHRTRTEASVIDNDLLLPEEKLFFESLVHLMVQNREQVLSAIESRDPIVVTPRLVQSYAQPSSYDQDYGRPEYEQRQTRESDVVTGATSVPVRSASDAGVEIDEGDTYSDVAEEGILVRFIAPVPKFVGKDLRVFGPYEEGQTANLPEDIAAILVKKGRAQEVDAIPEE